MSPATRSNNRWNRRSSDGNVDIIASSNSGYPSSSSDDEQVVVVSAAAAAAAAAVENDNIHHEHDENDTSHRRRHHHHRCQEEQHQQHPPPHHRTAARMVNNKQQSYTTTIHITEELKDRIIASSLASLVTFVTLSLLICSGQEILPVAWIGNVIAISTLKSTLGGTILMALDIFLPLIPVAMMSWGISSLLYSFGSSSLFLHTTIQSILLPLAVMMGSLCIILCPYLTMKNLHLVIFYLVVASPLSLRFSGNYLDESNGNVTHDVEEKLGNYFVPGLVGTCTVGLLVAVVVQFAMMQLQISTSASKVSHRLVQQLAYETQQLFAGVSEYTQNIGTCTSVARQSRTLIEFYVKKRQKTLKELERCLPALRAERYWIKSPDHNIMKVECFVAYSNKQQRHAELIRLATTQQFLGEEFTSQNDAVRDVKAKMSTNLGFAVEQIAQEYVNNEHMLLFSTMDRQVDDTFHKLAQGMESYKRAMRQAVSDAETVLLNNDAASRSSTGPLIRQRVAFLGLFSFVVELHDAIQHIRRQTLAEKSCKQIMHRWIVSMLKKPLLWKDRGKRRHAIKTALGMTLASAWVSIPYLREHISYPNSIWVGVTVASVNLESTGASYLKCIDRLWGTLIAGGFAILTGKVFDDTNGMANLLSITIFTFISIFLTNPDRPYASQYAATSVSSIMYGSFDFSLAVDDFVPTRVMLIFVGVAIVLVIELLVLPRSSRTIVQGQTLQFFEDLENLLFDASKACGSISSLHSSSLNTEEHQSILLRDDPLWMFREGQEKIALAEELIKSVDNCSKTNAVAKSELPFGISEPSFGLLISLDVVGYEFLLLEQTRILTQLDLLMTTIKSLIGFYSHLPENHLVRSLHWPALLSAGILQLAQHLSKCADELRRVFPNGLCQPGACKVSQIIRAVAVFRTFEDVILTILSDAEDRHATYLNSINSSGGEVRYTPGFRLTLALAESAILTIGQSLSRCGQNLETIVQSFPVEQVELNVETEQHHLTIISEHEGNE